MKKILVSAVASLMLLSGTANANDEQSIGASIGSIGIDAEYSKLIYPNVALRIAGGGFSYDGSYNDTDAHYETDLNLVNLGVTVEYHPLDNGLYVGAGLFYQNNTVDLSAKAIDGKYTFNGHDYGADAGTITGSIGGVNNLVPYLGIGYDASLIDDGNLFFTAKVGVWYQGEPEVELSVKDCKLPAGVCTELKKDLLVEENDINDDIEDYKFWPVLQVGISYRF